MEREKPHPEAHSWTARLRPRRNTSRGQGAVELALIAPILLVCMFGVVEMGRLSYAWVTMQHAARAGTRMAITGQGEQNGTRLSLIINASQQVANNLPRGGGTTITVRSWPDVTASGAGRAGNPGQPCELVEVEVQYVYQPVTPLISHLMPSRTTLAGRDRKLNEPWVPCP
jgi:Flp pilus assembly protein TadG